MPDLPSAKLKLTAECVMERVPKSGVWHIVYGVGSDTFQPILCGQRDGHGVNMPGPSEQRSPTCLRCLAIARAGAAR